MFPYEWAVRDQIDLMFDMVEELAAKFDEGQTSDVLLVDQEALLEAYLALEALLPFATKSGLKRHIMWMGYWLQKGNPSSCRQDVKDIADHDLPAVLSEFSDWAIGESRYVKEFAGSIVPLVGGRQLDSAVRKSFVLLKERFEIEFLVPNTVDGRDMVNLVYGQKGMLSGKLPEPQREATRNLLDGAFGVFRNRYGHENVPEDWIEAEAALALVNLALRTVSEHGRLLRST